MVERVEMCSNNHPLFKYQVGGLFYCSCCHEDLPREALVFGCSLCDFDMCIFCYDQTESDEPFCVCGLSIHHGSASIETMDSFPSLTLPSHDLSFACLEHFQRHRIKQVVEFLQSASLLQMKEVGCQLICEYVPHLPVRDVLTVLHRFDLAKESWGRMALFSLASVISFTDSSVVPLVLDLLKPLVCDTNDGLGILCRLCMLNDNLRVLAVHFSQTICCSLLENDFEPNSDFTTMKLRILCDMFVYAHDHNMKGSQVDFLFNHFPLFLFPPENDSFPCLDFVATLPYFTTDIAPLLLKNPTVLDRVYKLIQSEDLTNKDRGVTLLGTMVTCGEREFDIVLQLLEKKEDACYGVQLLNNFLEENGARWVNKDMIKYAVVDAFCTHRAPMDLLVKMTSIRDGCRLVFSPTLLDFLLKEMESTTNIVPASNVLSNISSWHAHQRLMLSHPRLVETLIRSCSPQDTHFASFCLSALVSFSFRNHLQLVSTEGFLQVLLEALQSDSSSISAALTALENFVLASELELQNRLRNYPGLVDALLDLIPSSDLSAQSTSIRLLQTLYFEARLELLGLNRTPDVILSVLNRNRGDNINVGVDFFLFLAGDPQVQVQLLTTYTWLLSKMVDLIGCNDQVTNRSLSLIRQLSLTNQEGIFFFPNVMPTVLTCVSLTGPSQISLEESVLICHELATLCNDDLLVQVFDFPEFVDRLLEIVLAEHCVCLMDNAPLRANETLAALCMRSKRNHGNMLENKKWTRALWTSRFHQSQNQAGPLLISLGWNESSVNMYPQVTKVMLVLCSVHSLPRLGVFSSLRRLPMDLVRLVYGFMV